MHFSEKKIISCDSVETSPSYIARFSLGYKLLWWWWLYDNTNEICRWQNLYVGDFFNEKNWRRTSQNRTSQNRISQNLLQSISQNCHQHLWPCQNAPFVFYDFTVLLEPQVSFSVGDSPCLWQQCCHYTL